MIFTKLSVLAGSNATSTRCCESTWLDSQVQWSLSTTAATKGLSRLHLNFRTIHAAFFKHLAYDSSDLTTRGRASTLLSTCNSRTTFCYNIQDAFSLRASGRCAHRNAGDHHSSI